MVLSIIDVLSTGLACATFTGVTMLFINYMYFRRLKKLNRDTLSLLTSLDKLTKGEEPSKDGKYH